MTSKNDSKPFKVAPVDGTSLQYTGSTPYLICGEDLTETVSFPTNIDQIHFPFLLYVNPSIPDPIGLGESEAYLSSVYSRPTGMLG